MQYQCLIPSLFYGKYKKRGDDSMKIYIMTDMEGVCGVLNHDDWVVPQGRYYEDGKKLLTEEVNAAVEGFYAAGATEILVADGHGGGINQLLLDKRTSFIRGSPIPYPIGLDESFDAVAWVGQHAKAGSEYAHIAHTGWFNVLDFRINGISVGEFGEMAMVASFLKVRSIFGSGDEAFCSEAKNLAKGIETVAVKRGLNPGRGDECDTGCYKGRNLAAIHIHPKRACELIRTGAEKALRRYAEGRENFPLIGIKPPYQKEIIYRNDKDRDKDKDNDKEIPGYKAYAVHPDNFIEMMNMKTGSA